MRVGAAVRSTRNRRRCRCSPVWPPRRPGARRAQPATRAEAQVAAKRLVREHDLPMKVVGVDYLDRATTARRATSSTSPRRTGSTSASWSATSPRRWTAGSSCASSAPATRPGCRAASARAGATCAARRSCKDFEPVSVRMAKDQDLPLNPLKISGACGRLMCCLKYEHPLYQEFKADAPASGRAGRHPGRRRHRDRPQRAQRHCGGPAVATGGRRCACSKADVCAPRKAYDQRPS